MTQHAPGHPHTTMAQMIVHGVFERFPTLRFYFAEINAAIFPAALYYMDRDYLEYNSWFQLELPQLPSEYMRTHGLYGMVREPLAVKIGPSFPTTCRSSCSGGGATSRTRWARSRVRSEYVEDDVRRPRPPASPHHPRRERGGAPQARPRRRHHRDARRRLTRQPARRSARPLSTTRPAQPAKSRSGARTRGRRKEGSRCCWKARCRSSRASVRGSGRSWPTCSPARAPTSCSPRGPSRSCSEVADEIADQWPERRTLVVPDRHLRRGADAAPRRRDAWRSSAASTASSTAPTCRRRSRCSRTPTSTTGRRSYDVTVFGTLSSRSRCVPPHAGRGQGLDRVRQLDDPEEAAADAVGLRELEGRARPSPPGCWPRSSGRRASASTPRSWVGCGARPSRATWRWRSPPGHDREEVIAEITEGHPARHHPRRRRLRQRGRLPRVRPRLGDHRRRAQRQRRGVHGVTDELDDADLRDPRWSRRSRTSPGALAGDVADDQRTVRPGGRGPRRPVPRRRLRGRRRDGRARGERAPRASSSGSISTRQDRSRGARRPSGGGFQRRVSGRST